jgi:hypothetical protein
MPAADAGSMGGMRQPLSPFAPTDATLAHAGLALSEAHPDALLEALRQQQQQQQQQQDDDTATAAPGHGRLRRALHTRRKSAPLISGEDLEIDGAA